MNDWDKALQALLDAELIDAATLEEAQELAEKEINPKPWKVWR